MPKITETIKGTANGYTYEQLQHMLMQAGMSSGNITINYWQ